MSRICSAQLHYDMEFKQCKPLFFLADKKITRCDAILDDRPIVSSNTKVPRGSRTKLHSRLRPLPRRNPVIVSAPAPDLKDEDRDTEVEESPEDVFGAFLPHLSPDDAPSIHGDPGQRLLYSSPHYGDLEIMVPSYPGQSEKWTEEVAVGLQKSEDGVNHVEEGRKLFAHFLWSAAMVVAEGIEDAEPTPNWIEYECQQRGTRHLDRTALPSFICALANASTVVATDHPSSPAFAGAIKFNMDYNLRNRPSKTQITIQPHAWGVLDDTSARENKGTFTRIIAADCYWMQSQHENLARTLQWFQAPGGKVWVVAGFHTGRAIVAGFFETALENGVEIERIFERDLISRTEDGEQIRREWLPEREVEGPDNRRRWAVVAVLKRKE
ncbi:uncharacterized protein N7498_003833 [Penicillium cinerascens]|uniref:Uncharacterized protein n=1 Tax=Penicillium cinerascens TaxID=70096 RepID=A0A9W9N2X4_9EURO|nr:uncharacterized protein N7498_003833 [Penicillium cinerascens]KAJ5212187.1 hypothetical protein N7498_003833 [Penicillium cinerascens]